VAQLLSFGATLEQPVRFLLFPRFSPMACDVHSSAPCITTLNN